MAFALETDLPSVRLFLSHPDRRLQARARRQETKLEAAYPPRPCSSVTDWNGRAPVIRPARRRPVALGPRMYPPGCALARAHSRRGPRAQRYGSRACRALRKRQNDAGARARQPGFRLSQRRRGAAVRTGWRDRAVAAAAQHKARQYGTSEIAIFGIGERPPAGRYRGAIRSGMKFA
jgi:hypothetical protein